MELRSIASDGLTRLRIADVQSILTSIAADPICRTSLIHEVAMTVAFSQLRLALCKEPGSELSFGAAMPVVGKIENASIATIAIRQCVIWLFLIW